MFFAPYSFMSLSYLFTFFRPHHYAIKNLNMGYSSEPLVALGWGSLILPLTAIIWSPEIPKISWNLIYTKTGRWSLMVTSTNWIHLCVLCPTWPGQELRKGQGAIQTGLCAGVTSAGMMFWNNASLPTTPKVMMLSILSRTWTVEPKIAIGEW